MLNINQVSKRYGNHVALDHVSFTIPKGSVFGLLGPNGAGKTSLLRIINQITGPDSGEILFNGEHLNNHHTRRIGYLPEERGLYKKMEVGEQALYLAQLKGLSRQEAVQRLKSWFERLDMKSWWNKKIDELSKGMQQKVQFIVTVVHEPELLVLDEPFTGFDPINAELIKEELLRLKNQGTTILLSTHRMESVDELCSHIVMINRSQKVLEGSVKEIRNAFRQNIYRIEYAGNPLQCPENTPEAFFVKDDQTEGDHRIAFIRPAAGMDTNSLVQSVLNQARLISFQEVLPGINEIFIQSITGNSSSHA
jgi:ABC-2 type transport system ATP-binding protein